MTSTDSAGDSARRMWRFVGSPSALLCSDKEPVELLVSNGHGREEDAFELLLLDTNPLGADSGSAREGEARCLHESFNTSPGILSLESCWKRV